MTYFVITGTEDGTDITECDSENSLREHLKESEIKEFLDTYSDPNYWGDDACLIIKGEILVPKAKKVVKEWEF